MHSSVYIVEKHQKPEPVPSTEGTGVGFSDIYSRYYDSFVRFAEGYVHCHDTAEDIVSDAITYFLANRHRLTEDTNIPAYIQTTIKHKCINHIEQQQVRTEIRRFIHDDMQSEIEARAATLEDTDPCTLYSKEIMNIVNHTLDAMPEKTRRIFRLSRVARRSHKEIATEMCLTTKAVEFHITKVLKRLRISLKDYMSF